MTHSMGFGLACREVLPLSQKVILEQHAAFEFKINKQTKNIILTVEEQFREQEKVLVTSLLLW